MDTRTTENSFVADMGQAIDNVDRQLQLVAQRILSFVPSRQTLDDLRAARLRCEQVLAGMAIE